MVQATHILQRPAQFQFDYDSYPCASSNCRPTSEAMIAGFYKDIHISPAAMRRAMGYTYCGGTDTIHSIYGLARYGVPATRGQLTKAELINKLSHNIPVNLAIVYGRLPRDRRYIQDFGFYGTHSVVACQRAFVGGQYGLWIRDPDRWGDGKVEKVFWPDSIWYPAWQALDYVSVWPTYPKRISVPDTSTTDYRIVIAPGATVYMVTQFGDDGCVEGWTTRKWGTKESSAPCLAPSTYRKMCSSGTSVTLAKVTAGVFVGKHVRITSTVKVVKS